MLLEPVAGRSLTHAALVRAIGEAAVASVTLARPAVIGISGLNAAGKTTLARSVVASLRERGLECDVVHVDDFHHPKEQRYQGPEDRQFLDRYFDWETLIDCVLRPLRVRGAVAARLDLVDLATDRRVERTITISPASIVIVEGVFLFRPGIEEMLDRCIYLDVSEETAIERGIARWPHLAPLEVRHRFERKYLPAQREFMAAYKPDTRADVVIDHEHVELPVVRRSVWAEFNSALNQ